MAEELLEIQLLVQPPALVVMPVVVVVHLIFELAQLSQLELLWQVAVEVQDETMSIHLAVLLAELVEQVEQVEQRQVQPEVMLQTGRQ
jgi:hypothetical protein